MHLTEYKPEIGLNQHQETDLVERLIVLAEKKGFLVKFVGIATVLSLIVALLVPNVYEGKTKLMPPQQTPSAASALLTQLGPLAALAGKDLSLRNPSDLYVDILRSRTIADDMIKRFALMQVYDKKKIEDARKRLEDRTDIVAGKDGAIAITVTDRDPQRAADMANAYVEELQLLSQTLAVTEAGKRRIFFEREVQKAGDELAQAEQALKETEEKTGMIHLDSQARAMLDGLIRLRSEIAGQEVTIQAMRLYATAENPDLVRAEQQLTALRAQLQRFERGQAGRSFADLPVEQVPAAGLEYLRRLREVKYREALMEALAKQYEFARIDEAKDASIIQVIDKAVRPGKKSGPPRTLIVLLTMFSALLIAVIAVFLAESLQRFKREDPDRAALLQQLKSHLFSRSRLGAGG